MIKFSTLLSLFLLFTSLFVQSQTVDNIAVEQAGDFIKIRYQILNSSTDQIYRVKVLCSINGGMNTEIRSISGDVGEQIMGGKSEYWVVWDVLKDVDELKSVEFIVRAEIIKDNSTNIMKTKNWPDKKTHILAVMDYYKGAGFFGPRIGYMGIWGVSAKITLGEITDDFILGSEGIETKVSMINSSLNITARLINHNNLQIHYLAGVAYNKVKAEQEKSQAEGNYYDMYLGIDMGIVIDIGYFSVFGGTSMFPYFNLDNDYKLRDGFYSFGLGLRF